jgi:hypothetical protein
MDLIILEFLVSRVTAGFFLGMVVNETGSNNLFFL